MSLSAVWFGFSFTGRAIHQGVCAQCNVCPFINVSPIPLHQSIRLYGQPLMGYVGLEPESPTPGARSSDGNTNKPTLLFRTVCSLWLLVASFFWKRGCAADAVSPVPSKLVLILQTSEG